MVLAMSLKGSWFTAHNPVSRSAVSLALALAAFASAHDANAHFKLDAPDSWAEQNSSGGPQKSAPCGERDSGTTDTAKPTNKVTPYKAGDTVTIKLTETVYHPGHYRVALAKTRAELPADPKVTAANGDDCASAEIDMTPEFPVLADGELKHSSSLTGQQTISVKLPADITCEKCTLQIIQFMSKHGLNNPGGCYYHHCADISITSANSSGGGGSGGNSSGGGPASGGAPSSGGAASSGGAVSGGASAGGSTSSGGATPSSGGATNSAGSGSGGAPGSGGSTVTAGGTTGTQGGSTAAITQGGAVTNPPVAAEDDGGCSVAGRGRRSGAALLALVGLSAFGFVRRRRSLNRSR